MGWEVGVGRGSGLGGWGSLPLFSEGKVNYRKLASKTENLSVIRESCGSRASKASDLLFFAIGSNTCPELITRPRQANAYQASLRRLNFSIPVILHPCRVAKIGPAIIGWVAIYVIDVSVRQSAVHEEKR